MKSDYIYPHLEGPNLRLRPVLPDDAAYIHSLRSDPLYNRHLSPVKGTVDNQRAWIECYQTREAAGTEIYFVIERKDIGQPCGTVRLYDIKADRFTWGSWILDQNKTPKAALESAVLSFGFGFDDLDCKVALVDVRTENTHAEDFYRRFGMTETRRTRQDIYFEFARTRFQANVAQYMRILAREAKL